MDCLEGIKDIPTPDLIIADPPYSFEAVGGGIVGMHKIFNEISEDVLNDFDFYKFIPPIIDIQKNKVNAYFFTNKSLILDYIKLAIERKLNYDILTMNKINPQPAKNNSYLPEIEYIIFIRSPGVCFNNDSTVPFKLYFKSYHTTVRENIHHPTEKPLGIMRKFITISSKPGDLILDPFAGSGTTLLAAKQLNRNYIGFEILEKYYKVALERLKQKTLREIL